MSDYWEKQGVPSPELYPPGHSCASKPKQWRNAELELLWQLARKRALTPYLMRRFNATEEEVLSTLARLENEAAQAAIVSASPDQTAAPTDLSHLNELQREFAELAIRYNSFRDQMEKLGDLTTDCLVREEIADAVKKAFSVSTMPTHSLAERVALYLDTHYILIPRKHERPPPTPDDTRRREESHSRSGPEASSADCTP